ncbi:MULTISPECIES: SCO1664 family protein [Ornithinimicrobium]|uniref:SCO1664 family protein n=1 Tax=Ornithinimicrobium kibberense TaxID=282060 RepID=A0ABV5V4I1_9MICO|nr:MULTISPECIES: SCO1664 family protein [Ornithinimicrobium]
MTAQVGPGGRGGDEPVPAPPDDEDAQVLDLLSRSRIELVGRLVEASNLTLLVDLCDDDGRPTGHQAVYKPDRGARPLADFPPGTLARREVAAYLVSRAGGWDVVPPTLLRDGPLGPGSVQAWVEQDAGRRADPSAGLVEVLPADVDDPAWMPVVQGEDQTGRPVVVAHADRADLRAVAVLDVVLNNADRKAAHLTVDVHGRLRGFDHGLTLHADDKLRTVLWGWAGQALDGTDRAHLERLVAALDEGTGVERLLAEDEVGALRARVVALLAAGHLPAPPVTRYPLPWPLW